MIPLILIQLCQLSCAPNSLDETHEDDKFKELVLVLVLTLTLE